MSEPQPFEALLDSTYDVQTKADGPEGSLPLTPKHLLEAPSGDLFGLTQNAGMGWKVSEVLNKAFLILSTAGGLRNPDGKPVALGYHTGHWELDELVRAAAETFAENDTLPFAAYCSDPCDGRSQGTPGMFDSLPYRNDAAILFRRLTRSLPTAKGVLGVATCDKGLPAMMMALAGTPDLPTLIVPGGVTLPPREGEDAGTVQTLGARYAHDMVTLQEASELGCRACATSGGGCQFLGTAATSQVIAEALGLALPHSALTPSGQAVWREVAVRSAYVLMERERRGLVTSELLSEASVRNAMVVHAAFGGSTNLLLHIPAIAHAAGLPRPTVGDWRKVNRETPRLVSVLPNGPVDHSTVRVFLAGGVPEVMLHLRDLDLLDLNALSATGQPLEKILETWESSERRQRFKERLFEQDGVDPDDVIFSAEVSAKLGLGSSVSFLTGNLAPDGAIVKSTAIDPSVLNPDGSYSKVGPARVFTHEKDAIQAIKEKQIKPGDIMVLCGVGPAGTGMEETYQITSALKHLPFGKEVALITDARFSGVSTGACIGHIGPEGLAGGPIGKVLSGDRIRIHIDAVNCTGALNLVGTGDGPLSAEAAERLLGDRPLRSDLAADARLPEDTRLWAALQALGGGTWGGCVYDTDAIIKRLAGQV